MENKLSALRLIKALYKAKYYGFISLGSYENLREVVSTELIGSGIRKRSEKLLANSERNSCDVEEFVTDY